MRGFLRRCEARHGGGEERHLRASASGRGGPNSLVRQLSGGNQQKVVLGKWLATNPRILIMDEPTRGIDVGAKAEIHLLMRKLAGEGMAILMISSELPEVLGMSDRVLVMNGGRIVAEFDKEHATAEAVGTAMTRSYTRRGGMTAFAAPPSAAPTCTASSAAMARKSWCPLDRGALRRGRRRQSALPVGQQHQFDLRRQRLYRDCRDRHVDDHHRGPHRRVGRCADRRHRHHRGHARGGGISDLGGLAVPILFSHDVVNAGVGALVAYTRIPSIVVTLGMLSILKGGLIS
jgi:hypothetical protein